MAAWEDYRYSLCAVRYDVVGLNLKIFLLLLVKIVARKVSIVHPAGNGSKKWRLWNESCISFRLVRYVYVV